MKVHIKHQNKSWIASLLQGRDLSLAVSSSGPRAWYMGDPEITPVQTDSFIGSVKAGSSVNFYNIGFNPHAQCTHTECVGHISEEKESVNASFKDFFSVARLISICPEKLKNVSESFQHPDDLVITRALLESALQGFSEDSLLIRTLPNGEEKTVRQYSNSNPPYFTLDAMDYLVSIGVKHLLTDLPSVDRELDDGKLLAHKSFWNYPHTTDLTKTITELIFVEDSIADGLYLLNLQVAPFENDAAPSRPLIFPLQPQMEENP